MERPAFRTQVKIFLFTAFLVSLISLWSTPVFPPVVGAAKPQRTVQSDPMEPHSSWDFKVTVTADTGNKEPSPSSGKLIILKHFGEQIEGRYAAIVWDAPAEGSLVGEKFTLEVTKDKARWLFRGTLESGTTIKGTVEVAGQPRGTFLATKPMK